MALDRGNKKEPVTDEVESDEGSERKPALPDFARRALSIGLSGFFLTEETIRKALGDTLPKDWMDFATEQSERTRKEFLERLSFEIAQSMQQMDLAAIMREILEGTSSRRGSSATSASERTSPASSSPMPRSSS